MNFPVTPRMEREGASFAARKAAAEARRPRQTSPYAGLVSMGEQEVGLDDPRHGLTGIGTVEVFCLRRNWAHVVAFRRGGGPLQWIPPYGPDAPKAPPVGRKVDGILRRVRRGR